MPALCCVCKTELKLPNGAVSMHATCDKCGNDVRACRNCRFYDVRSYNECREPQAERIVDKERRNRCDFFVLALSSDNSGLSPASEDPQAAARKKLEDLFK